MLLIALFIAIAPDKSTYLFTIIMSYLKSIEIILLLIALFIAIAPDKRVICISVVFKNQ